MHSRAEEAECADSMVGENENMAQQGMKRRPGKAEAQGNEVSGEKLVRTGPKGPCKHVRRLVWSYG